MKKRFLFAIGFVFLLGSFPLFAEGEIESEFYGTDSRTGYVGSLTFYKDKTFTFFVKFYDNNGAGTYVFKGTFKGDTTKEGDIKISLLQTDLKAEVDSNNKKASYDIHKPKNGLFVGTGTIMTDLMGEVEFSFTEGSDGLVYLKPLKFHLPDELAEALANEAGISKDELIAMLEFSTLLESESESKSKFEFGSESEYLLGLFHSMMMDIRDTMHIQGNSLNVHANIGSAKDEIVLELKRK